MRTPPPRDDLRFSNTAGILPKKKTMWFIGVEVEQQTSAPPPKKKPGSAPAARVRTSDLIRLATKTYLDFSNSLSLDMLNGYFF